MHNKDKAEKILEDYNDVFADIYNVLVFGKTYIKEDGLKPGATESIYKAESGGLNEQRRDILKNYQNQNLAICSLGIENQSDIDDYMPLRIMGYDFATYQGYLKNKKALLPTITIVLNFSDKRWNKSKTLHGMLQLSDELKPYVADYAISIYDVAFLEDDVIERFSSDFKLVAKYLKKRRLGKIEDLAQDRQRIKHVEAVLDLFRVFTKDERYENLLTGNIKYMAKKGEDVSMCIVLDTIEQRGIEKGISQGRLGLLKKWVMNKKITLEEAAEEMEMTVAELQEMFAKFNIEFI